MRLSGGGGADRDPSEEEDRADEEGGNGEELREAGHDEPRLHQRARAPSRLPTRSISGTA